jgi:hypothetical protein
VAGVPVALADEGALATLDLPVGVARIGGADALESLATRDDVDLVVVGTGGLVSLRPVMAALGAGKVVATANKETLVAGGHLVMPLARELAAGMAGMEEGLDCGAAYEGNAYADAALPSLPKTLRDAVELLDKSRLARRALGDGVVDFYVHTGRLEVAAFDNAVTDWERVRYFERI